MIDCVITGVGGNLGSVVRRVLAVEGRRVLGVTSLRGPRPSYGEMHGELCALDLCEPNAVERLLRARRPRLLLHLAAQSVPSEVLRDPQAAHRINVEASARLARLCAELGTRFVFASTDLVFAGDSAPYTEHHTPRPLSVYGAQKLEAERAVLAVPGSVVARLPLMYGLPDASRAPTFFLHMTTKLLDGEPLPLFVDEHRSVLDYVSAATALGVLAQSELGGVVHIGGPASVSRFDVGCALATALGASRELVRPSLQREQPMSEPRPADVSLCSERYLEAFRHAPGRPLPDVLAELAAPLQRWHAARRTER